MFPLTPDQHHWLEVATEDEGWDWVELWRQNTKRYYGTGSATSHRLSFILPDAILLTPFVPISHRPNPAVDLRALNYPTSHLC